METGDLELAGTNEVNGRAIWPACYVIVGLRVTRYVSSKAVRPVLDYLQRLEVESPQIEDPVLGPVDVVLDKFWRYLTVERALATVTAHVTGSTAPSTISIFARRINSARSPCCARSRCSRFRLRADEPIPRAMRSKRAAN